jgi:hypothetical protein
LDHLRIYGLGIAKPEYIKREEMTSDPGANACANVRKLTAMVLKTMDITIVMGNVVKRKKKKAPASRDKLVMKYNGTVNVKGFRIL